MSRSRTGQILSLSALALAVAASVATSAPLQWELNTESAPITTTLTTDAPVASQHVVLAMNEAAGERVRGELGFKVTYQKALRHNDRPRVLVNVVPDDPTITTWHGQVTLDESGDAYAQTPIMWSCEDVEQVCADGATITFELVGRAKHDTLEIVWTVLGTARGNGENAPAGLEAILTIE